MPLITQGCSKCDATGTLNTHYACDLCRGSGMVTVTVSQPTPPPSTVEAAIEELLIPDGLKLTIDQPLEGKWRVSCRNHWAIADTWQAALQAAQEETRG